MNGKANLTPKEKQIVRLITRSIPRKKVAAKLDTSVRVIDNALVVIYAKCQAYGLVALTHWAIVNKLVKLGDVAES